MACGHERLDVYRAAIEYVGWAYRFCEISRGHAVREEPGVRRTEGIDPDADSDPDAEGNWKELRPSGRRGSTPILLARVIHHEAHEAHEDVVWKVVA
jgi:hypothetical protein